MGDFQTLMARDGHQFGAWLAAPHGAARGAVVVLQEIFGLNSHIRAVTDRFAADGYLAIAPSLFDRVRRDLELGYTADDVEQGRGTMRQLVQEKTSLDVLAAINVVKHAGARSVTLKVEVTGGVLRVVVTDDGRGFAVGSEPDDSNGIRNLRERMAEAGGAYRIESRIGAGTRVTVE